MERSGDRTGRPQLPLPASYYELLVESLVDYAAFVIDRSGYILTWNAGAERIKGYRKQEVIGRHFSMFYPQQDVDQGKPVEALRVATEQGHYEDYGWRKRADGELFWANVIITALRAKDGTLEGFGKLTRDLTDRKRHEDEILRLNAQLEQRTEDLQRTNGELESFSYSVSHDLRAPLRAINGFAALLLRDQGAECSAETVRKLSIIKREADRMGTLIDDLLAFSRSGRKQPRHEPVDMQRLVREVFDRLLASHEGRRPELTISDLPRVSGDRALLEQVWVNLASNALKFSSKGDDPRIEVGSASADGHTVYFVKDNGAGFDPRYIDKLFGVFQRLHRASEFPGTGVGLALVQRIVNRHGGRVWATGTPGAGATFYFTLPQDA